MQIYLTRSIKKIKKCLLYLFFSTLVCLRLKILLIKFGRWEANKKKNKDHKEARSAQYWSLCPQVQRYWKKQLPECEYFMQLPKEGMHISLIGKKCWTVVCFINVYWGRYIKRIYKYLGKEIEL